MADLRDLPNEVLVMITRSMVGRRIDHFDPVATRDLQSLRLVSPRFNAAAIPTLFENMVLDFSSFKLENMRRIISFARLKPGLAIHIRRLQLRTPASTIPFWAPDWCPCPIVGHIQQLQDSGLFSDFGLNQRHSARIHELIVAPLEAQWEVEVHNFDAVRKITHDTMAVLPRLHHVENAISTHDSERMARAYQSVWDEMKIDLTWYFPTVAHDQSQTLSQGVAYLMTSLTSQITSLKLREVPFERWLYHWCIPTHIEHLDLELRITQEDGIRNMLKDPVETRLAVQDWRVHFSTLKSLKTLRLSLSCEGLSPNQDEWFEMGGPNLYFDDLLSGIELSNEYLEAAIDELEDRKDQGISEASVIDHCTFPQLESLMLFNCPLREHGLLYLAAMHKDTLREVEMHRVVFDAITTQVSVQGLAEACRRSLPNLAHLVLSKIKLYDTESRDPCNGETGQEAREEAAAVYRWDKKEGGGGDGLVRCAWDLGGLVEGVLLGFEGDRSQERCHNQSGRCYRTTCPGSVMGD